MKKLCIFSMCRRKAQSRGLCDRHYQLAARYVRLRQTSWKELIELALAMPAKEAQCAPFMQAVKLKRAGKRLRWRTRYEH